MRGRILRRCCRAPLLHAGACTSLPQQRTRASAQAHLAAAQPRKEVVEGPGQVLGAQGPVRLVQPPEPDLNDSRHGLHGRRLLLPQRGVQQRQQEVGQSRRGQLLCPAAMAWLGIILSVLGGCGAERHEHVGSVRREQRLAEGEEALHMRHASHRGGDGQEREQRLESAQEMESRRDGRRKILGEKTESKGCAGAELNKESVSHEPELKRQLRSSPPYCRRRQRSTAPPARGQWPSRGRRRPGRPPAFP